MPFSRYGSSRHCRRLDTISDMRVYLAAVYLDTSNKCSCARRIGGNVLPKGLGNLGNFSNMIKHALEMKGKMEELKESLASERIEASAGGGMVKVEMNGRFELQSVKIEPEVVDSNDIEMLETLVTAAVNDGIRQVQELVKSKMTELTGGIEIPGLT